MNKKREFARMLRLALIVLTIAGLAGGCAPTPAATKAVEKVATAPPASAPPTAAGVETQTVETEAAATTMVEAQPTRTCDPPKEDERCNSTSSPDGDYERCQVLIIGPQRASGELVQELECLGYRLKPRALRELYPELADERMGYLIGDGLSVGPLLPAGMRDECQAMPAHVKKWLADDPVVYLYEIDLGTVEGVVKDATAFWQAVGAYASPNSAVGLFGSPHTIGPSPWAPPACGSVASAGPDGGAFTKQWAWDDIQLGNPQGGQGVTIGVFDTSPYDPPGPLSIAFSSPIPNLSLSIADYRAFVTPFAPAKDLKDHGLAVAGLAHAVAPESDISLYRVLGDDGAGRLLDLNVALAHFLYTLSQRKGVINLSLGLIDQPLGDPALQERSILRALLGEAYCQGVPVVAAAGNHGTSNPTDAQVPAAWTEYTLSVAASQKGGGKACFSNPPDDRWRALTPSLSDGVMAPGGQGVDLSTAQICQPGWQDCDPAGCDIAVISRGSDPVCTTGYAFWAGTSFATPLASGLAARVIEASNLTGPVLSDTVRDRIKCGAAAHNGVINVDETFNQCP
jgi:hypothetical protein